MTSSSVSVLADSLTGTFPACDDAPLALALLRELAKGDPVSPAALAVAGRRAEPEITAALARWPNVHRDERGRILAFSGLSLAPTPHCLIVSGRQLYAWCAWDTLFLPGMLGEPAHVRSSCAITGTEVRLTVQPAGIRDPDPPALRLSFPPPGTTSATDITGSFCRHVHFVAGDDAAERWLSAHAGGIVLPLDDAFQLGKTATTCCA